MMKLSISTFSLTVGCLWSFFVLTLGIISLISQKGTRLVELFGKVYVGYARTLSGCLIGAVWGFIDGVITGLIIAWLCNLFLPSTFALQ